MVGASFPCDEEGGAPTTLSAFYAIGFCQVGTLFLDDYLLDVLAFGRTDDIHAVLTNLIHLLAIQAV